MGAQEDRTQAREGASHGEVGAAPLAAELVGEGPLVLPSEEAIEGEYYPLLLAPNEVRESIFEQRAHPRLGGDTAYGSD